MSDRFIGELGYHHDFSCVVGKTIESVSFLKGDTQYVQSLLFCFSDGTRLYVDTIKPLGLIGFLSETAL